MKILFSRRFWLIKYTLLIPAFIMLLNLKANQDNIMSSEIDIDKQLELKLQRLENVTEKLFKQAENQKLIINKIKPRNRLKRFNLSSTSTSTASKKTSTKKPSEEEVLSKFIHNANNKPVIQNRHLIDHLLQKELTLNVNASNKYTAPKFLVILIQIHSRYNYLQELIDSLENTRYINETLVIFSHDVFVPEMNDLIKKIKFCATLQIFYPYSIQLYKDKFPGKDPNDCEKSFSKKEAILKKCNNAYHYDSYGHYREHAIVQIKHHWFWKLGFVFEKLNETKEMSNLQILLLEEDHYVMPDAIHTLRKLSENLDSNLNRILSDIDVVSLAHIEKLEQDLSFENMNMYAKAIWHTSHHNTGLMFGRAQWIMLKDCLNAFCTYDDYNWDWTLQYISQSCFPLPLVSIYPSASRVIHIGKCGTHYKGKNCDPKDSTNPLKKVYKKKHKKFFPSLFNFEKVNTAIRTPKSSNGGWSDPRDHQLCKSFLHNSVNLDNITIAFEP